MKILNVLLLTALATPSIALADNSLSSTQLVGAIQAAVADYSSVDPDMARSISGVRATTVGANASVLIEMNADGMKMSAKYSCAPRGQEMACRSQQ
jgi:hypothetical protein